MDIEENMSMGSVLRAAEAREGVIARAKGFEEAQLRKVFQDEYAERMRMPDLIDHLRLQSEVHEFADDPRYQTVERLLTSFSRYLGGLINGRRGEREAARALGHLRVPSETMRNVCLEHGGERVEIDDVVVNQYGIFLVEVKFYTFDAVIDECGLLRKRYGHGPRPYNVPERFRTREAVLEGVLDAIDGALPLQGNVHSILCFTNDNCGFEDSFGKYAVCRCGNLPQVIEDACSTKVFSADQVRRMAKAISESRNRQWPMEEYDYEALSDGIDYVLGLIGEDTDEEAMVEEEASDRQTAPAAPETKRETEVLPNPPAVKPLWRKIVPGVLAAVGAVAVALPAVRALARTLVEASNGEHELPAGGITDYDGDWDDYDYDEETDWDYDEGLSVDDAALIWASSGKDEDYMFGYGYDELEDAL